MQPTKLLHLHKCILLSVCLSISLFTSSYLLAQESLFIDSAGNIGIGTTKPSERLTLVAPYSNEVAGSLSIGATGKTGTQSDWKFLNTQKGNKYGAGGLQLWSFAANSAALPRFVISEDGYIGIGTNKPIQPLHVSGTIQGDNNLFINGCIGINTTATDKKLSVAGDAGITGKLEVKQLRVSGSDAGTGKMLVSDDNGNATWIKGVRKDYRPYGTPSYYWSGFSKQADNAQDPVANVMSKKGTANFGWWDNSTIYKKKYLVELSRLTQESYAVTQPPADGIYFTLPCTPGVTNSLLISTVEDRFSCWSVWICNGDNCIKLAGNVNNSDKDGNTYMLSPYNSSKETRDHAWIPFAISEDLVNKYKTSDNKIRFLVCAAPNNKDGSTLYLSGLAMVPNPYGFVQQTAVSVHFGLCGNGYNNVDWGGYNNFDGAAVIRGDQSKEVYIKVIDPNKDLMVTFYESNNDGWIGNEASIKVGNDNTVYHPSAGLIGIGSTIYGSRRFNTPLSIVIPAATVKAQLTSSKTLNNNSLLKLTLTNKGNSDFYFRGVDCEFY